MKLGKLLENIPVVRGDMDMDMEITGISYDTRTIQAGALFVAMSGERTDGHRHIETALERGAVAVVCSEHGDGPRLFTPDTRLALAHISANWFHRPGEEMCLVGVTGTNGKTTTTHLLKAALEGALGATVGMIGTNHNMIGTLELPAQRTTPESYELHELLRKMADRGCTHVVMEVSSHALVQHRTAGLTFDVGVLTNLTQDHLDYHGSMQEYYRAKGLLFAQSRRAVINIDDEAGRRYLGQMNCPVMTYSENKDAGDLTAKHIRLFPGHVDFVAVARGQLERVHLPIPGGFTIYNALATLCCCMALDIPLARSVPTLRSVHGVKGRIEVVPVPLPFTVLIDYAHTPDALENILTTARDFTAGRLICLFGCGGDRDRTKRPIMGAVVAELADLAVITSDNPRTESPETIIQDILPAFEAQTSNWHMEPDRIVAIRWVLEQGRAGDVIVLAGKGHETYQEVCGQKIHMDEREIVADFFQNRQELGRNTDGKRKKAVLK